MLTALSLLLQIEHVLSQTGIICIKIFRSTRLTNSDFSGLMVPQVFFT
ncbi:hypothetical protein PPEP_b0025 [Pseudoalteromonas peptidolytica F12-50-A1]|uniref:Uncharacterized protein n=1 Tax=Pseudoalteromonas peptidolytica F12-50-A1 TaxID=1315280 RepID=A0A8I0MZS8_9GAMM|nr:hypothetical protein [Pseudoalteromonas peptidolytica F12-50-A1]